MKRRNFIRTTALLGGGLVLSFRATGKVVNGLMEAGEGILNDFVTIMSNGDVHFQFVKHEMGQGVSTAMAQIFADELCADWEKVKIDFPAADMKKYQNDVNGGHDTGGSCTIIYQWDMLRKAGATAKQMLINAAAQKWKSLPADCYADNHFIIHKSSSKKIGFGDLASAAAKLKVPADVPLKKQNSYQHIGQSKAAKLIPSMITGKLQY